MQAEGSADRSQKLTRTDAIEWLSFSEPGRLDPGAA
jgi:hypothetical protein